MGKSKLIKSIQDIEGVILVEPIFDDPQQDNQILVCITFLNIENVGNIYAGLLSVKPQ